MPHRRLRRGQDHQGVGLFHPHDAGHDEELTSKPSAAVEARSNSAATARPTISGTPEVGETLT